MWQPAMWSLLALVRHNSKICLELAICWKKIKQKDSPESLLSYVGSCFVQHEKPKERNWFCPKKVFCLFSSAFWWCPHWLGGHSTEIISIFPFNFTSSGRIILFSLRQFKWVSSHLRRQEGRVFLKAGFPISTTLIFIHYYSTHIVVKHIRVFPSRLSISDANMVHICRQHDATSHSTLPAGTALQVIWWTCPTWVSFKKKLI